jgi:hypothetical protein
MDEDAVEGIPLDALLGAGGFEFEIDGVEAPFLGKITVAAVTTRDYVSGEPLVIVYRVGAEACRRLSRQLDQLARSIDLLDDGKTQEEVLDLLNEDD